MWISSALRRLRPSLEFFVVSLARPRIFVRRKSVFREVAVVTQLRRRGAQGLGPSR